MFNFKNRKNIAILFAALFMIMIVPAVGIAETVSNLNPGLRNLSESRYAKVYTLTSQRYYGLYSDTNLTRRLSSTAWTGENDEVWIIGVGVNSRGVAYARIKYPVGSSRITAYMNLRETFVPGTLTGNAQTARSRYYGLSRRRADYANSSYGIDPGDSVYLLTRDSGWCQVLYPTSTSQWRIAWMTESAYNDIIGGGDDDDDGDDSAARNAVVAHAESILNYTWTSSNPILLYYNEYRPYESGGNLYFSARPVIAKGTIRGIPYTLSSNNTGGGQEKTFDQYKSLSATDKSALSNIYTYGGSRISMKYGMSCATFVTDCILHGLSGSGLSAYPVTNIHQQSGWRNYITMGSRSNAGYQKLKKGDYLYTSGHVRLVTANNGSSITVIEQAPADYTRQYCSNKKTVTAYFTYKGKRRAYTATQVCMQCDACKTGTTGTKKTTYYYSSLSSSGYYPMYVSYPTTPTPNSNTNPWKDSSMSISYNFMDGKQDGSYSDWVRVSGGSAPYTPSISSGSLPDGLSLSQSNASTYLKGTPTKAGTYKFTLRVTGSHNGYAEKTFTVKIDQSMYIRYTFKSGKVNSRYSDWVQIVGGTAPYTCRIVSGSLPNGLVLTVSGAYVYLRGTPTRAGSYSFTLRVTDRNRKYVDKKFSISISSASSSGVDLSAAASDLSEEEQEEREKKALEEEELGLNASEDTQDETQDADVANADNELELRDAADLTLVSGYASASDGGELVFEIGAWKDEAGNTLNVTDQKVYVGGELTNDEVDEYGYFTLGSVDDEEAAVYVTAEADGRKLRSKEFHFSASDETDNQSDTSGGSSGCDAGVGSAALLCLIANGWLFISKPVSKTSKKIKK